MKRCVLLTILITVCSMNAAAQNGIHFSTGKPERVAAASIFWMGSFGSRKEEPQNAYMLMTQGEFRAPKSKNLENLVKIWTEKHPKAEAVLVYSMEGSGPLPGSKWKSVWVIDGGENLNLYLVRNGACPAGTMVLSDGDETPLSKEDYGLFEKKFWEAEKTAKLEKLGIWLETKSK